MLTIHDYATIIFEVIFYSFKLNIFLDTSITVLHVNPIISARYLIRFGGLYWFSRWTASLSCGSILSATPV